jgi:hypothetical protein
MVKFDENYNNCSSCVPKKNKAKLRPALHVDCVHFSKKKFLEKFLEKNNFLKKFSRNSRKKIEIQISFFYSFGILTTKMTTKMYTKLASIEINDEILTKVGRIRNFFGKNF